MEPKRLDEKLIQKVSFFLNFFYKSFKEVYSSNAVCTQMDINTHIYRVSIKKPFAGLITNLCLLFFCFQPIIRMTGKRFRIS